MSITSGKSTLEQLVMDGICICDQIRSVLDDNERRIDASIVEDAKDDPIQISALKELDDIISGYDRKILSVQYRSVNSPEHQSSLRRLERVRGLLRNALRIDLAVLEDGFRGLMGNLRAVCNRKQSKRGES